MRIATVYAQALFETLSGNGERDKTVRMLAKGMDALIEAVDSSKAIKIALYSPATSSKEKESIVKEIGKKSDFPDILTHFLRLLARKGRLEFLPEIRQALDEVRLDAEGGILGEVVTPEEMSKKELKDLAKAFSEQTGKKVEFKVSIDPDLLAGIKVTLNGVTYDGSLKAQLGQLRKGLLHQNVHTVH